METIKSAQPSQPEQERRTSDNLITRVNEFLVEKLDKIIPPAYSEEEQEKLNLKNQWIEKNNLQNPAEANELKYGKCLELLTAYYGQSDLWLGKNANIFLASEYDDKK